MVYLFVLLGDLIVVTSVAIDSNLGRVFFHVVEAVTETEEILHLHFLIEFYECIVKLRQAFNLVLTRYVYIFYGARIFQLPTCTWIDFDGFFFYSDSSVEKIVSNC